MNASNLWTLYYEIKMEPIWSDNKLRDQWWIYLKDSTEKFALCGFGNEETAIDFANRYASQVEKEFTLTLEGALSE